MFAGDFNERTLKAAHLVLQTVNCYRDIGHGKDMLRVCFWVLMYKNVIQVLEIIRCLYLNIFMNCLSILPLQLYCQLKSLPRASWAFSFDAESFSKFHADSHRTVLVYMVHGTIKESEKDKDTQSSSKKSSPFRKIMKASSPFKSKQGPSLTLVPQENLSTGEHLNLPSAQHTNTDGHNNLVDNTSYQFAQPSTYKCQTSGVTAEINVESLGAYGYSPYCASGPTHSSSHGDVCKTNRKFNVWEKLSKSIKDNIPHLHMKKKVSQNIPINSKSFTKYLSKSQIENYNECQNKTESPTGNIIPDDNCKPKINSGVGETSIPRINSKAQLKRSSSSAPCLPKSDSFSFSSIDIFTSTLKQEKDNIPSVEAILTGVNEQLISLNPGNIKALKHRRSRSATYLKAINGDKRNGKLQTVSSEAQTVSSEVPLVYKIGDGLKSSSLHKNVNNQVDIKQKKETNLMEIPKTLSQVYMTQSQPKLIRQSKSSLFERINDHSTSWQSVDSKFPFNLRCESEYLPMNQNNPLTVNNSISKAVDINMLPDALKIGDVFHIEGEAAYIDMSAPCRDLSTSGESQSTSPAKCSKSSSQSTTGES